MSTEIQVLHQPYQYIQRYIQLNGGQNIIGCGPSNFTFDVQFNPPDANGVITPISLTIHSWTYSFPQPTVAQLMAYTDTETTPFMPASL